MDPNFDDDADLATADRGDALPAETSADDKNDDTARDTKGRFVKPDAAKDETAEADIAADEPVAAADDDESDDVDDDAGKDIKSLTSSRAKALQQRDREREARIAAETKLRELQETAPRKAEAKPDPVEALSSELDTMYLKVEEARADGDVKQAAQLQRQIDAINRDILKHESAKVAERTNTAARLNERYDAMLDVLEAQYPQFDPQADEFDVEQVKELNFTVTAFEKAGMTAPDALRKGVSLLLREDPFGKTAKRESKPAEEKKPVVVPIAKKTDVAKSIDTNRRQPPDTSERGVNKDESRINPMQLTEDDFDKLPDSKKRELRGDFAA